MADDGSILVTGAAGQLGAVGRTVTRLLLDRGLLFGAFRWNTLILSSIPLIVVNRLLLAEPGYAPPFIMSFAPSDGWANYLQATSTETKVGN
jgi:hypothetical protein